VVNSQRALLEEREKEIRKIAQSINDVVEIFKDVNSMIIEQVCPLPLPVYIFAPERDVPRVPFWIASTRTSSRPKYQRERP
jgi:hypothetical protein